MESNLIYKVYDFFNQFIHSNDIKESNVSAIKRCPVTGLDISMQSKHTKFITTTGIKWYYKNEREIYYQFLATRLTGDFKKKDLKTQFKIIAHSIRNAESNPRNNTKRKINQLIEDKESLFNNYLLIDKQKLKEAGMLKNNEL